MQPSSLVIIQEEQQQGEGMQMAAGKQGTVLVLPDTAATVHHTELAAHIAVVGRAAEVGEGMHAGGIPVGVQGHMLVEEVVDSRGLDDALGVAAGPPPSLLGRGWDILLVTCVVEAPADTAVSL